MKKIIRVEVLRMKKKIVITSLLAVFMLLAISYATAVNTTTSETDAKESPLYGIRARRAISDKIKNIVENIKAKFLGDRLFFLPFRLLRDIPNAPMFFKPKSYEFEECTWYPSMCNGMLGCVSYYYPDLCTVYPGPDRYCATNKVCFDKGK